MDPQAWTLLANMGFPALVAGFVLIRLNGKMDALTDAVRELTNEIRASRDQAWRGHAR